ncbi:class I SAM-dependent methyltransferase [Microbacterium ulmi]|uniref:class I SAM-dependent methyltransferase n=1 Tax=Microbacterium ulmi TaxID=179095 RepID=UPI00313334DA|nr:ubiquinone/menaquinone biosynthesis C-methylase UbiE [Microbacterium ulmi]
MDADAVRRAIREAFDERAEAYDESAMHRALASEAAAFAELATVRTVLDVATGTGLVLRALAERRPQLRMTGVDVSAGMLAVARRALPSAEWVQADAVALPAADGSVDLVTCATALHIIVDTDAAISEWARVLAPGGRVVTATFAQGDHEPGHVHAQTHDRAAPRYPRVHGPFASPEALARTVAGAGFAVSRHALWSYADDHVLIAELTLDG